MSCSFSLRRRELGAGLKTPKATCSVTGLVPGFKAECVSSQHWKISLKASVHTLIFIAFCFLEKCQGLKIIIVLSVLLLPLLGKLRQLKSIRSFLCTLSVQIQVLFVLKGGFLHLYILVIEDCCKMCLSRQHSDYTKWLPFLLLFGVFTTCNAVSNFFFHRSAVHHVTLESLCNSCCLAKKSISFNECCLLVFDENNESKDHAE